MATQPQSPARLAFGPFEVDATAGELRKSGVRVRLAAPGDVVTRELLREQIWGEGTFVDFEHGLSAAMYKLRRALGDSAGNPRYIETVPGRGYRFLGSLQEEPSPIPGPIHIPDFRVEKSTGRFRRGTWVIAVSAVLLAFAVAGYFYLHRAPQGTPRLTDKDKIVLADFTNTTGDPVFDDALRQGLAVQLEQSPFLSLVSEEHIQRLLPLMGQPPAARLTPELAREICERTASAAVLEGSVAKLGASSLWAYGQKTAVPEIRLTRSRRKRREKKTGRRPAGSRGSADQMSNCFLPFTLSERPSGPRLPPNRAADDRLPACAHFPVERGRL